MNRHDPMRRTTNCLVQRDQVGKAKPSLKVLPGEHFVYGKSAGYDPEGAREVTMSWKFHGQTRNAKPRKDFRKLNKMCIKQHLTTSKVRTLLQ